MSYSFFVPEILRYGMLFNIFQERLMPRVGALFVDLNTTDRVHSRAEIIQLAAVKLSTKPQYYNDFAIPSRGIRQGSIRYHGITKSYGNLYRDGQLINNPWCCEKDLIVDFASWINKKYDKVYLIHHSPWKRSVLDFNLEHYEVHIYSDVVYVDIMEKMNDFRYELNLNNVSLNEIFRVLEDSLYRRHKDAHRNAQGMKCCALNGASNLQITVKDFLDIDY